VISGGGREGISRGRPGGWRAAAAETWLGRRRVGKEGDRQERYLNITSVVSFSFASVI
jgi:hypothetical protein